MFISFSLVSQTKYQKDFNYLWDTFNDYYAYFDKKQTNWKKVKEIYQDRVDSIKTDGQFISVLEEIIYEFYDAHISLNRNNSSSFRLIPTSLDANIEIKNNKYFIKDIRQNFEAEKAGLKIGDEILMINGKKINQLITDILPESFNKPKKNVKEFFANLLFAGRHNEQREISIKRRGEDIIYKLGKPKVVRKEEGILNSKIIEKNIGYIKFNNSLGNNSVIKSFQEKVDEFENTRAIILDLRDTPSGGNAEVAKSIMGKFITKTISYQKHEKVSLEREFGIKRSWIELVTPLKKPYRKPVIVLVGRWTGSIGEAIAQGFDNIKSAKVVGTEMAKLLGAIGCNRLPETNINICFPIERLYHINGMPRESFKPEIQTGSSKEAYKKAIQILNE
ncbi:carboxyl-terminal processing protease [Lutibacter sp. Hel_I_33_5]|nr:carboxyl-terminal processing protease [Lutibacter sp. Hel_I_33_5]